MAVSGSREVERKFEAPQDVAVPDDLGPHLHVEAADELRLVATYYDTPGLRLLRHGATLRYRTGEGDADGWHLKLPAGPDARHELHVAAEPGAVPPELLALLRAHRKRPSGRRAAEQSDEGAALHSITSSTLASSCGGTSRPRVLAVLMLMTNSNLVGCWTGKSSGLAPLRMRSMYPAASRDNCARSSP